MASLADQARSIIGVVPTVVRRKTPPQKAFGKVNVPAILSAGGGRFPAVVYNAHQLNAYKPNVVGDSFPEVRTQNPNLPPSMNPHAGIPRQGPTPNPTGHTIPGGAWRPGGRAAQTIGGRRWTRP